MGKGKGKHKRAKGRSANSSSCISKSEETKDIAAHAVVTSTDPISENVDNKAVRAVPKSIENDARVSISLNCMELDTADNSPILDDDDDSNSGKYSKSYDSKKNKSVAEKNYQYEKNTVELQDKISNADKSNGKIDDGKLENSNNKEDNRNKSVQQDFNNSACGSSDWSRNDDKATKSDSEDDWSRNDDKAAKSNWEDDWDRDDDKTAKYDRQDIKSSRNESNNWRKSSDYDARTKSGQQDFQHFKKDRKNANYGDSESKLSNQSSITSKNSCTKNDNKSYDARTKLDQQYFNKPRKDYRSRSSSAGNKTKLEKDAGYYKFEKKYMNNEGNMDFHIVKEEFGDLFCAGDEYSLGHCVAEDMNMGSGIAVTFRQMFKRVDELLNQRQTQGGLAVLQDNQRYIYYLVTKRISSGKPYYYTLWSSLQKMKNHIVSYDVKKLALPRIGCGLDSLEWNWVKKMLEFIFQDVEVEIKIFNFQQDPDAPAPTKLRKCNVVNEMYPISKIESGTIIIYFGSEDGYETEEIKTISEKFMYIRNFYKNGNKQVGKCIHTDKGNTDAYTFYGCIVRKRYTDPFDFIHFQECLKFIQRQNRKDKYVYVAFQAFTEDRSIMTTSKIINLMRYSLTAVDVYVCWPENLQSFMPRSYN